MPDSPDLIKLVAKVLAADSAWSWQAYETQAEEIIAAINSSLTWAVVPREATAAMCEAAADTPEGKQIDVALTLAHAHGHDLAKAVGKDWTSPVAVAWKAMISAHLSAQAEKDAKA